MNHQNGTYASFAKTFFKIKPADNAGHDFLGIRVPQLRKFAKKYDEIDLEQVSALLKSDFNETRALALMILVRKFNNADAKDKDILYDFYIKQIKHINNWNLVDASAPYIVGAYLADKDKNILIEWTKSTNMWVRRIAIVSTLCFIRQNHLQTTLTIAKQLLNDKQDLIHKAVGWMLRELGKKNESELKKFIKQHYASMPRTTLRYAIERFSPTERKNYLKGIFND